MTVEAANLGWINRWIALTLGVSIIPSLNAKLGRKAIRANYFLAEEVVGMEYRRGDTLCQIV